MLTKNLSILLLILFVNSAIAADDSPIEQLKSYLSSTKTLTADFKQVSFNQDGKPAEASYGLFYLSRPGKFRWTYEKPFAQEIVSSLGKVWFYDADLEQVTIKKLDGSLGSSPALLLSANIILEDEFIIEKQGKDEGLQWIKLSPKKEGSGFKYILIGMNKGVLGGMELSDNFGQLTRIYFSNIKRNIKLDDKQFIFTVPKGADVFES